jgi:hypothetical protein
VRPERTTIATDMFTVEFEDGTQELIFIDQTLLRGLVVFPRTIAREKQEKGELPGKPIKSVTRCR